MEALTCLVKCNVLKYFWLFASDNEQMPITKAKIAFRYAFI